MEIAAWQMVLCFPKIWLKSYGLYYISKIALIRIRYNDPKIFYYLYKEEFNMGFGGGCGRGGFGFIWILIIIIILFAFIGEDSSCSGTI